jgi:ATP-binding cassette subfamily C protein LapB
MAFSADDYSKWIYRVTSWFDSTITPSEIRALFPAYDAEKDLLVDWLTGCLADVGVQSTILGYSDISDKILRDGVGVCFSDDKAFLIWWEQDKHDIRSVSLTDSDESAKPLERVFSGLSPDEFHFLVFHQKQIDEYSALPDVERHWFFGPIYENRRYILLAGFAALLTNLFALGASMFSLVVYNKIIPAQAMTSLFALVVIVGAVLVADYIVRIVRSNYLGIVANNADKTIADSIFAKLLDLQFRSKKGSVGALANTIKEYEGIREFMTSASLLTIIDLPFALFFLVFIALIGKWMVVPVFIGVIILVAANLYIQPKLRKISEVSFADGETKNSVLVETLTGLESVKLLGAGSLLRRRFRQVLSSQIKVSDESKKHTHFAANLTQEVQQGVQVGVVAVGALVVSSGELSFGSIIACTILSSKAVLPFAQLGQLLLRLNQVRTGYKALDALMQNPTEHADSRNYVSRGSLDGQIRFEDVSFSYPGQRGSALEGINFSIPRGERVAIVGRIGSGKTTIGKLITRLYNQDAGKIRIDGIDISQIDPSEIRENVGYVPQEPWLMTGTIEQNISLGSPEITIDQVIWAASITGISEFIDGLSDGYSHKISERGEGLSGGQKQCIAVARALVRRPPILILDEPTSSMDARTEKMFIDAFSSHSISSTVIVITHRTSLLKLVNHVIVLDAGKVVGSGPAAAFLNPSGNNKRSTPKVSAELEDSVSKIDASHENQ